MTDYHTVLVTRSLGISKAMLSISTASLSYALLRIASMSRPSRWPTPSPLMFDEISYTLRPSTISQLFDPTCFCYAQHHSKPTCSLSTRLHACRQHLFIHKQLLFSCNSCLPKYHRHHNNLHEHDSKLDDHPT